jgi:hypothetical protein
VRIPRPFSRTVRQPLDAVFSVAAPFRAGIIADLFLRKMARPSAGRRAAKSRRRCRIGSTGQTNQCAESTAF